MSLDFSDRNTSGAGCDRTPAGHTPRPRLQLQLELIDTLAQRPLFEQYIQRYLKFVTTASFGRGSEPVLSVCNHLPSRDYKERS